jgi:hypothetical protein
MIATSRIYTCKKCDDKFPTVLELANHVRITHKKKQWIASLRRNNHMTVKKFQCRKCDFSTDNRHTISQHYRWKHPVKKEPSAYMKKKAAEKQAAQKHPGLHFCPCCGLNLEVINAALSISGI